MGLTNEHVGPRILAKIKTYVLTRAELLITLCYEIPCNLTKKTLLNKCQRWLFFPRLFLFSPKTIFKLKFLGFYSNKNISWRNGGDDHKNQLDYWLGVIFISLQDFYFWACFSLPRLQTELLVKRIFPILLATGIFLQLSLTKK